MTPDRIADMRNHIVQLLAVYRAAQQVVVMGHHEECDIGLTVPDTRPECTCGHDELRRALEVFK